MVAHWRLGICVLLAAGSIGCIRTRNVAVTQPNPLIQPTETLRVSEELTIVTGDMELRAPRAAQVPAIEGRASLMVSDRVPLLNKASFTVVTRDRLRFHVQLEHKWKEYVDIRNWRAYLVDDKGHRYVPVDVDQSREKHVVMMWDYETRTVRRNRYGDVVGINNDRHKNRQTLGSLSVFRGTGDYVFYSRDIFTEAIETLTLVLEKGTTRFKFTWRFTDEPPADLIPPGLAAR